MKQHCLVESHIERWATVLQQYRLVGLAVPVLDVLKVWGFVLAQGMWMLAPFFGERTPAALAEMLEHPEQIEQFQRYLIKGDIS